MPSKHAYESNPQKHKKYNLLLKRQKPNQSTNPYKNPIKLFNLKKLDDKKHKRINAPSSLPLSGYGSPCAGEPENINKISFHNATNQSISFNIQRKLLKSSISKIPSNTFSAVSERFNYHIIDEHYKVKSDAEYVSTKIKQMLKQSQKLQTSVDFYKIGNLLGRGGFGKVNLGVHKLTGRLVAIKSIKNEQLSSESSQGKIMQEYSILKNLRHPSIIRIYETFENSSYSLFVFELCAGGDLLSYVRRRKKLKENLAKHIFKQIVEGIQYCHSNKILHRDIKLENILICSNGHIKICDFGVSKIQNGTLITQHCGTPVYVAPEVLEKKGYHGFGSDVWSAGVVLYAMLYGTVPFKASEHTQLNSVIKKGEFLMSEEVSEPARNLLSSILKVDPAKRATVQDILKHPWMQTTENIRIFNEVEIVAIKNEFVFAKDGANDDIENEFSEQSIESTINKSIIRNESSRSLILAPFNSTGEELLDADEQIIKKKQVIKFERKIKEIDRQYEKNNNGDLDNGVYNKFIRKSSTYLSGIIEVCDTNMDNTKTINCNSSNQHQNGEVGECYSNNVT